MTAQDGSAGSNAQANDTRPGGGLGVPIDTPDPLDKYKWWILGGITLVFAVGAGFLLRRPGDARFDRGRVAAAPVSVVQAPVGVLAALKDELFALETDHLQGVFPTRSTNSRSRHSNWFCAAREPKTCLVE